MDLASIREKFNKATAKVAVLDSKMEDLDNKKAELIARMQELGFKTFEDLELYVSENQGAVTKEITSMNSEVESILEEIDNLLKPR